MVESNFSVLSIISVTKGIFPVKERIFLVIGNLFPDKGIKKNPLCNRIIKIFGIFPVTKEIVLKNTHV